MSKAVNSQAPLPPLGVKDLEKYLETPGAAVVSEHASTVFCNFESKTGKLRPSALGDLSAIRSILDIFKKKASTKPDDFDMETKTTIKDGKGNQYAATNRDMLMTLLDVACELGTTGGVSAVDTASLAMLGMNYSDVASATGEQAKGTFRLGARDAAFVIMSPSAIMRTIVVTLTVGTVKVTIIIKW